MGIISGFCSKICLILIAILIFTTSALSVDALLNAGQQCTSDAQCTSGSCPWCYRASCQVCDCSGSDCSAGTTCVSGQSDDVHGGADRVCIDVTSPVLSVSSYALNTGGTATIRFSCTDSGISCDTGVRLYNGFPGVACPAASYLTYRIANGYTFNTGARICAMYIDDGGNNAISYKDVKFPGDGCAYGTDDNICTSGSCSWSPSICDCTSDAQCPTGTRCQPHYEEGEGWDYQTCDPIPAASTCGGTPPTTITGTKKGPDTYTDTTAKSWAYDSSGTVACKWTCDSGYKPNSNSNACIACAAGDINCQPACTSDADCSSISGNVCRTNKAGTIKRCVNSQLCWDDQPTSAIYGTNAGNGCVNPTTRWVCDASQNWIQLACASSSYCLVRSDGTWCPSKKYDGASCQSSVECLSNNCVSGACACAVQNTWTCTGWTSCINGQHVRTCTPPASCPQSQPATTESCTPGTAILKKWQPSPEGNGPPYCNQPSRFGALGLPSLCSSPDGQILTGQDCTTYPTDLIVKTSIFTGDNYVCKQEDRICAEIAPTGAGVTKGSATYTGTTTQSWTYDSSGTAACKWTCSSGYTRSGNGCLAVAGTPTQPDITFDGATSSILSSAYTTGATGIVRTQIKNVGTADANNLYWRVGTGSTGIDSPAGQCVYMWIQQASTISAQDCTFTVPSTAGTYNVWAEADFGNTIAESNENNNKKNIGTITATTPVTPTCTSTDFELGSQTCPIACGQAASTLTLTMKASSNCQGGTAPTQACSATAACVLTCTTTDYEFLVPCTSACEQGTTTQTATKRSGVNCQGGTPPTRSCTATAPCCTANDYEFLELCSTACGQQASTQTANKKAGVNCQGGNVPTRQCAAMPACQLPSGTSTVGTRLTMTGTVPKKVWKAMGDGWGPAYCDCNHEATRDGCGTRYEGPLVCSSPNSEVLTDKDCSQYSTGTSVKTSGDLGYNYICQVSKKWKAADDRTDVPGCECNQDSTCSLKYNGAKICTTRTNQVLTGQDCTSYVPGTIVKTSTDTTHNFKCEIETINLGGTVQQKQAPLQHHPWEEIIGAPGLFEMMMRYDVNLDGRINRKDTYMISSKIGASDCQTCDINNDGSVTLIDVLAHTSMLNLFGSATELKISLQGLKAYNPSLTTCDAIYTSARTLQDANIACKRRCANPEDGTSRSGLGLTGGVFVDADCTVTLAMGDITCSCY